MELEIRGTPTVVICTNPFLNSAGVHARTFGRTDFKPVGIPHPLGGVTADAVKDRAESLIEGIVEALTS
jgi:hypothetical protein